MEYIRLVHPRHFDPVKQRFGDLAFKVSSDGSFSLVCKTCAESRSVVCEHIRKFYPDIAGEPPVFLIIKTADLPATAKIIETLSDTGDDCHRDIEDAKPHQKHLKDFRKRPFTDYQICDKDAVRALIASDIVDWPPKD